MAGRGPAPSERRVRERDQVVARPIEADGRVRGPRLPAGLLGEDWHLRTKAWYESWRRSAQAQEFTATDWDFLLDTAVLHHVMWSKGKWDLAPEVRLRAAKFGATPEDRARLRISVTNGPKAKPATDGPAAKVTSIASRRSRLTG